MFGDMRALHPIRAVSYIATVKLCKSYNRLKSLPIINSFEHFPKFLAIYMYTHALFLFYSHIIINYSVPILFFCINISGMY